MPAEEITVVEFDKKLAFFRDDHARRTETPNNVPDSPFPRGSATALSFGDIVAPFVCPGQGLSGGELAGIFQKLSRDNAIENLHG